MHHKFTPLPSAHAAAQGSFLDGEAKSFVKEAEEILRGKGGGKNDEPVE